MFSRISHKQAALAKLHIVSTFLTDMSLLWGQERMLTKKKEIVAIPKLLEDVDIRKGDVVTIHALNPKDARMRTSINKVRGGIFKETEGSLDMLLAKLNILIANLEYANRI